MTCKERVLIVDDEWVQEPELADAGGDLLDLLF
jgi:hypothetical protein